MDENKNLTPEQSTVTGGFDSVTPTAPKTEGTFNPTPMFSALNQQKGGYTVTPEGGSFTAPPTQAENPATAADSAPSSPLNAEDNAPVSAPVNEKAPDFMPSGTYSYSAAKGNLQSGAYETPDVNPPYVAPEPKETAPNPPVYVQSNGTEPPKNEKPKKQKRYGVGIVVLSTVLAAVLGFAGAFGGLLLYNNFFVAEEKPNATEPSPSQPQNITNITVDETTNSTVVAVAKKASPSIVGIRTTAAVNNFFFGSTESTGEGSGIIYTTDGYIITNYHVIQTAVESTNSKVEVFLQSDIDSAIPATVIGYNIAYDLAVVKVAKTGLPAIEFANSDEIEVGEQAIAIGNPGGLEFIGSVSEGIVSGLNRTITVDAGNSMSLIQTDAAISPGNSGGALVNNEGKLIGVNSIKLVSTGYESMGFAIPSNTVKEICDNIIAKESAPAPYIGWQISQSYSAEQLQILGYPAGAVVVSVAEGSPAEKSEIKRGDIITEFDGIAISDYKALENAASQCNPGDSITVKFYRAGRFYAASIEIIANNSK